MIKSTITAGQENDEKLLSGATKLADAVTSTLGPLGKNVALALANDYGIWSRVVLHDGVSVAKAIALEDEVEDMGAQILKQAALKTVDTVGDGTSVTILLSIAILKAIKRRVAAGYNPMALRREIEKEVGLLINEVDEHAIPIKTFEQVKHIATISAEDEELGELVAKTMSDMGVEGLVYAEESKSAITSVEKVEGMQFDKGMVHEWFMTNPERNEATLENALYLITDKSITSLEPLKHIIEYVAKVQIPFVMLSPHFGDGVIAAMLENKRRGLILPLLVSAPSFGKNQANTLEDIALFTASRFISEKAGHRFEDMTEKDLGSAQSITSNKAETIIVGGKGKKSVIDARIASLKDDIEREEVEFDREKMKERLARLTSGVAVINVGGATEIEMKERLERVKDAIAATRAAMQKGIVPGGETIYLSLRQTLAKESLLYDALYQPFAKLLANAGLNDGEYYEKLQTTKIIYPGVNVLTGDVVNLVKAGIVDPALVPIEAFKNASSVAIQLATTGTSIIQYSTNPK